MEFADPAKPQCVRFVLLRHTLPEGGNRQSHWDLMFDSGDFLLTFAMQLLPNSVSPSVDPGVLRAAVLPQKQSLQKLSPQKFTVTRLADHRLAYLDYEGPIAPAAGSNQASRGNVQRLAAGHAQCAFDAGKGHMHCRLQSPQLSAELFYTPCQIGQSTQMWIASWQLLLPS